MELEVVAQIQKWVMQSTFVDEQECNQQPSDSSVPVEERVDRLELSVCQADFDQQRVGRGCVEEHLEVVQGLEHVGHGRWDECCGGERSALGTDPVLGPSELARRSLCATHAVQEAFVDLLDQPERQG